MRALDDVGFRRFMLVMLSLYVIAGFFGTVWIADEFDDERTLLVSYGGVPVAMLFYGLCLLSPGWWRERPRSLWVMVVWIVAMFGWGNVMLLNSLGGSQSEVVDIESQQHTLDIAFKRGGLGWLYRERF